jgi:hypothetical protein
MADKRTALLIELERLQASRRDAMEAYNSTGNRAHMLEAREASHAIADKLSKLEEMNGLAKGVDALMGTEQ